LNLEKDLSPEHLVTIKLSNEASRKLRTALIYGIRLKRAYVIFAVSLSRMGRVLQLTVGKVAFACYSSSSRSSPICLAWEQYKLAQVGYSVAIRFLNDLLQKIQMEKNHI